MSRPRPEFYYLCNYKGYADAVDSGNYTLYNSITKVNAPEDYANCYDQQMVSEATSSWPSGHSSMSFCSLLVTSIVIREMLNIKNVFTLYGMISFSPLIISLWIAVSRCLDNKHHEDDVLAGAIIGCTVTLIVYDSVQMIIKKVNINLTINYNSDYHRIESDDYGKTEIVAHHI